MFVCLYVWRGTTGCVVYMRVCIKATPLSNVCSYYGMLKVREFMSLVLVRERHAVKRPKYVDSVIVERIIIKCKEYPVHSYIIHYCFEGIVHYRE